MPESTEIGFYGWYLVVTVWVVMMVNTAMPFYGGGILNAAMARFEGIDQRTVGLGYSILILCAGLGAPLVALFIRRWGVRATFIFGSCLITAGAVLMGTVVQGGSQFVLVFGILIGLGSGFGGIVTAQSAMALWFTRRRATAIAIVMTGTGIGGFLAPPLLNAIVGASGEHWRRAWLIVALLTAFTGVISALFVKNSPHDLNQHPDGIPQHANGQAATSDRVHRSAYNWPLAAVTRTAAFWISAAGAVGASAAFLTYAAHGVVHLQSFGHSSSTGALSLGLIALFSLIGRLVGGVLCDRFEPRFVWTAGLLCAAGSLISIEHPANIFSVYLFAILLGLGYSASLISWSAMLANYFGPVSYPSILGAQSLITSASSAVVPVIAGMLFYRSQSYSVVFSVLTAFLVCVAALMLFARPPRIVRVPVAARSIPQ